MKHTIKAVKARTYNMATTAAKLNTTEGDIFDRLARGEAKELNPVIVGLETRFPMNIIDELAVKA